MIWSLKGPRGPGRTLLGIAVSDRKVRNILMGAVVVLRDGEVFHITGANSDYAHPMKEDVKKKRFSPPLRKMRVW